MKDTNYCKRCGLVISKDRKSNFCSDLCNLMPSNFNNQEATIYRDGYTKGKQEERERILKELPKEIPLDDKYSEEEIEVAIGIFGNEKTPEYLRERRYGFNNCLKRLKSIISNK